MALLMLLPYTGFSIDLHYCKGELKSFSLVGKAKSCHAKKIIKSHCVLSKKSCPMARFQKAKKGLHKKGCCSNKSIKLKSNTYPKKHKTLELNPVQLQFITAFTQVFIFKITGLSKAKIPHIAYEPPLLYKDIPVLAQSFLI